MTCLQWSAAGPGNVLENIRALGTGVEVALGVHLIGIPAPGKKECFAPSALALAPHLA